MNMVRQNGKVSGIVHPNSSMLWKRCWLVLLQSKRFETFLFLSPLKQISNLVSYSFPLRDEDWEINRVKSPALFGFDCFKKGFSDYIFRCKRIRKACVKFGFPSKLKHISGHLSILLPGI